MVEAARVSRARRLRVEAGVQRRSTTLFIGPEELPWCARQEKAAARHAQAGLGFESAPHMGEKKTLTGGRGRNERGAGPEWAGRVVLGRGGELGPRERSGPEGEERKRKGRGR